MDGWFSTSRDEFNSRVDHFGPWVLLVEWISASHAEEPSSILGRTTLMTDDKLTISFLVVSELFDRYTVVVNTTSGHTSVHCDECNEWVETYDGDMLSTQTTHEFLELIVADHSEQVMGSHVSFDEAGADSLLR